MFFVLWVTTEYGQRIGKSWASFDNIGAAYRLMATMKASNKEPCDIRYKEITVGKFVFESDELEFTKNNSGLVMSIGCVACAVKGFDSCDCASWETSTCD